ncbi:VF530 family protein [Variovorax paradoxus]|uniref:DNA-binding protein n=1 Tax=Variovorax paradoxus TaxID=34073 RepID=A0A679J884_VARPD|nr:DNA-binding protein [Variovorax paradoxus]
MTNDAPAPVPAPAATSDTQPAKPARQAQPRNPLHGLTLEAIVTALADHYGWEQLSELVPIRCFAIDPSVGSSLKFLRKTPWAREKVESLYLFMLREQRREQQQPQGRQPLP